MRGGSLFFQKALGIEHNCSALPYPLPYPSVGVPLSPVLGARRPLLGAGAGGGYFTLLYNLAIRSQRFSVQPTRLIGTRGN